MVEIYRAGRHLYAARIGAGPRDIPPAIGCRMVAGGRSGEYGSESLDGLKVRIRQGVEAYNRDRVMATMFAKIRFGPPLALEF